MTAQSVHEAGPLEVDLDIELALDELSRSFPGLRIWFGEFTGSLWALLPDRLVEAKTAAELARKLNHAVGRSTEIVVRRPDRCARRQDGSWRPPEPRPARWLSLGRFVAASLRSASMSGALTLFAW